MPRRGVFSPPPVAFRSALPCAAQDCERAKDDPMFLQLPGYYIGAVGEDLTPSGFGDRRVSAYNQSEPGRAQNRRAELVKN
jgi:hypothetical protein